MSDVQKPLSEADRNIEQNNPTKPQVLILECEKSADHFRNLLKDTRTQLTEKCDIWNKFLEENDENIDENVKGSIRTVVGQANLVMRERGKQFESLIHSHEFGTSEKVINSSDLQGFWDMIYFQVEDVEQKFVDLQKRKERNWAEDEVEAPKQKPRKPKAARKVKKVDSKPSAFSEKLKQKRMEARKRLQAAKVAMKKDGNMKETFNGGFFKIESPVKENVRPLGSATKKLNSSALKQSPLVTTSNRKKPVTPSNSFLHGRQIRSMTSQSPAAASKKKLQFHVGANECGQKDLFEPQKESANHIEPQKESANHIEPQKESANHSRRSIGDEITEGGDNNQSGLSPKKKTKVENDAVVGSEGDAKSADVAKEEVKLSPPNLKQESTKQDAGDIISKLNEMQKLMSAGFENMSLQISKIPTPTTGKYVKFQQDSSAESAEVDEGLIEENKKLKEEVESLKAQLSAAQRDTYKEHYLRAVDECRVYQGRLEVYKKLADHLPRHQEKVDGVARLMREKAEVLRVKSEELKKKEEELAEKDQLENQELLILQNTIEQYKEKMLDFDQISAEYHDLKKDNENLKFKVQELTNKMVAAESSIDELTADREQICMELNNEKEAKLKLINELDNLNAQVEFERNEEIVDKQFQEKEMEKMQSMVEAHSSLQHSQQLEVDRLNSELQLQLNDNRQQKSTIDEMRKQNEELSLKLADKSSELTQLKSEHSACDEKMFERSQGVLSKLEVLHKNLINNRTEQTRRSLNFLNDSETDSSMNESNTEQISTTENVKSDSNNNTQNSVGDNLSGNLLKASEIVDKISDVHAKIKKKNEDDHLMLRCNFRTMKEKLDRQEKLKEQEMREKDEEIERCHQNVKELKNKLNLKQ